MKYFIVFLVTIPFDGKNLGRWLSMNGGSEVNGREGGTECVDDHAGQYEIVTGFRHFLPAELP